MMGTFVPIYLGYFWLWLRHFKFGWKVSGEKWSRTHVKNAARFYRLAVRMKGGLIKVGQIISTRVDIMPPEWIQGLEGLQDRVDPLPWKRIAKHLTQQFGAPPDELFAEISHEAVAAASFGQVHRATLKDGRDVALKVKYADIDMKLGCDLFVFRCAVPLFNIFIPKVRLDVIHHEVAQALVTELDYRKEAEHTRMIGKNLEEIPGVVVPKVVDEYTTESVICTTYFEGIKITDTEKRREAGLEEKAIIQKIVEAYAHMFFIDGVFQSDPHPGNLFVRRGPEGLELCILDFGQVKILPRDFQRKLIMASIAFMGRDVDGFAKAVVAMDVLSEKDVETAKPLLREFFEELYELSPAELKELDAEAMKEKILEVVDRIDGVTIPQDIVLYGRAFGLLAGVIAALDPEVNGIIVAKPMIMQALMRPENFAPLPAAEPEAELAAAVPA
tara:strand:- start:678 stop:2009 length:1332 start_codon:yes stop_codon:yes gene_type:complete